MSGRRAEIDPTRAGLETRQLGLSSWQQGHYTDTAVVLVNRQSFATSGSSSNEHRCKLETAKLLQARDDDRKSIFFNDGSAEDAAGADLSQTTQGRVRHLPSMWHLGFPPSALGPRPSAPLHLRCGDCGHDKLVAFNCKRRGFCLSCGAPHMGPDGGALVTNSFRTCRCASGCSLGS